MRISGIGREGKVGSSIDQNMYYYFGIMKNKRERD
jgi:hypothetical protein